MGPMFTDVLRGAAVEHPGSNNVSLQPTQSITPMSTAGNQRRQLFSGRAGGALPIALLLLAGLWRPCLADEADDQYAIAAGHYARGRWQLAAEEFEVYLSKHPTHAKVNQARFLLGESLLQLGRTEQAVSQFQAYLAAEPQGEFSRQSRFRIAEAAFLAGSHAQAAPLLEQFVKQYPEDRLLAYALAYLGEVCLARGDAASAVRHFRDCLQRFPQGRLQDDCRLGLARALEKLDQHEEAERLYMAVAGKAGQRLSDEAQFRLGAFYYNRGRNADALEALAPFEGKLSDSPWRPHALLGKGWALWKLGRLEEAKRCFESIAADATVGVQASYWLGLTEKALGNYKAAAEVLLKTAQKAPEDDLAPQIWLHAGEALLKAGDPVGAAAAFDKLIARGQAGNQWLDAALRGKIQAALQQSDHQSVDQLAQQFETACATSRLRADVDRLRAASLVQRKQFAEAAALLEPLIKAGQSDAQQDIQDRCLLAAAYEGLKRYEDGLSVLRPVLEKIDEAAGPLKAEVLLRQGTLLAALGRHPEAVPPLEAALTADLGQERSLMARGELAVCYVRTGQLDKARRTYAQLLENTPQHPLLPVVTEQLAEAAYAVGEANWAAELFQRLSQMGQSQDEQLKGLSGLAWSLLKAGKLAEAAEKFDQLLRRNPPAAMAAEAALARGQCLEKLQRFEQSLAMYQLVVQQYPQAAQHAEALLAAARLCEKLRRFADAAGYYQRLVDDHPRSSLRETALYGWAWALLDSGRAGEGRAIFERLVAEYPQSRLAADAAYRLAQQAFSARDYPKTKKLLQAALAAQADPEVRKHAQFLLGQTAVAEEDWLEVRRLFEDFARQYSDSALKLAAEFWVAESFFRRHELDAAEARLGQLAKQCQGRSEPWMAMIPLRQAQILGHRKKWDEAYKLASTIKAQYPDFEQQYEVDYLIGLCLHDRAELDEARKAFERVIRSPAGAKTETAAMAHWMIGETYFHQKNYEAAKRTFLAVEILYDYPKWQAAALLEAAKCCQLLGQHNEAVDLYARITTHYRETPYAEAAAKALRNEAGPRKPAAEGK